MATEPTTGAGPRHRARLVLGIAGFAALATLAVAVLFDASRQRIADNEAAQVTRALRAVLPAGSYDNQPERDHILAVAPELLGSEEPLPIYRARLGGQPAAAVITAVARQGYVGPIRLLVSLAPDGSVLAVRAIAQQETPGLGDRIDAAKSSWLQMFSGRSLGNPDAAQWAVARDGGAFDQLAGATVTSRAVVGAVRDAAVYFQQHREEIFAQAPAVTRP